MQTPLLTIGESFITGFVITAIVLTIALILVLILVPARQERTKQAAAAAPPAIPAPPAAPVTRSTGAFDEAASYNVAGINMHSLQPADCGLWYGSVECEPENPQNPNSVAVLKGASHIGHLDREIAAGFYWEIARRGGSVPAKILIQHRYDAGENSYYFIGRIQILWSNTPPPRTSV